MKIHALGGKALWFLFVFIISLQANGQELVNSRQTSFYTYIYKLTNREAGKIYKKDIQEVDASFFHSLVDSFPTDSQYTGKLPAGHYLRTYSEKNKQKISIATVQNLDVFVLNNNTDLCIQVYDLDGNVIHDAEVGVGGKSLKFNQRTQSYLDKKSNRKGLLKVTYKGFTSYFDLKRDYSNSLFKRGTRKVIYGTPLKYVWMPVNFVLHVPIDVVWSLAEVRPNGTISRTLYSFARFWETVACLFDDSYCDYYNYGFERRHTGYIAFNKPKYHPGDTVHLKAFLVTKKGKAIDKPVKVMLQANEKKIELISELKPYRKGGYEYQFYLHDSLQLDLDRSYHISLVRNPRKVYEDATFVYEDYELSKTRLDLRIDKTIHHKHSGLKLFVKGLDENDLNLLDARVEVLVKANNVSKYFGNQVFMPDTILFLQRKLEPKDETEISISDSLFPKANFDYDILVRLLTSDNEWVTEQKNVQYFYETEKFDIDLVADSLNFEFKKNGVAAPKKVTIFSNDSFGNPTQLFDGQVPCKMAVNPYFASYTIKSDSLVETMDVSSQPSLLHVFSERTNDSLFIEVDNPRNLPFSYNVYLKNTNEYAGYSQTLSIREKAKSKQNYFISIRYLWGGKVQEENYRIPLTDKKLNVSVTQPAVVYPGQKAQIEVFVTDFVGNPVEGVDLTAYSVTKKFNYSPPNVPYLGKNRKNKVVVNNFNIKKFEPISHPGLKLDYASWKLLAGLDSIEYYQFIYPGDGIYRSEYRTSNSLTQFAPFIVSKGAVQPIHVIFVDEEPVYFSWSTNVQPYSFKITSGYHQIKLRTNTRVITLDSLYFTKGKKLIFSLNEDLVREQVKIEKVKPNLSLYEKRVLYKYIFPYRFTFRDRTAFLEQKGNVQSLTPQAQNQRFNNLAGPIAGYVTFNLLDGFSTDFLFEPFFEYEFAPKLLKMRSYDEIIYPGNLRFHSKEMGIYDEVLTRDVLNKQWKNFLELNRFQIPRYQFPTSTTKGNGRLLFDFAKEEEPDKNGPLNILVFKYDNPEFLRVYPGRTSLIHELSGGYHKLIFFYSGGKYKIVDSLLVKPNGLNYFRFKPSGICEEDSFSITMSHLIKETLFYPTSNSKIEAQETKKIFDFAQQQYRNTGIDNMVEGYVYDAVNKELLVGANVWVPSLGIGTITNYDGYYTLQVPPNTRIVYSFIGYRREEINIGFNNTVNVPLKAYQIDLSDVVVVGSRMGSDSGITNSIEMSTSVEDMLQGRMGSVELGSQGYMSEMEFETTSGSPADAMDFRIRGTASLEFGKAPLYIINGNVFNGDITQLDPAIIESIEVLKDANAIAVYGVRGANGVVLIVTKPGTYNPALLGTGLDDAFDNTFYDGGSQLGSIRDNFSDDAFWQPKLVTNEAGKATFEVTFPDDVTSWETFYLAMNDKKQSGQSKNSIKSFKSLMAQLAVPRFLVQNDTTFAIGKVLNYSADSIEVTTRFEINQGIQSSKTRYCVNSMIDTILVSAADSVSVKYCLEKSDGYLDGEIRDIPVFPMGLEETKGHFYVLDQDTTLNLESDPSMGELTLYARADELDVVEDEISQLIHYMYSCNEQIASKLKALLAEKNIAKFKGEAFKHDYKIGQLIRLLNRNQKDNGIWGWWKDSGKNFWISLHVFEALIQADKMGYPSKLNKSQLAEMLVWELESSTDIYDRIRILKMLNLIGSTTNFGLHISEIERNKGLSLNSLLQIIELKQLCKLDYDMDTLQLYQKNTLFGNVYFEDENQESNLLNNTIQNTLMAYRILKADSSDHSETLRKMRNYFFENRNTGLWRNTFESAQIIEAILPDILSSHPKVSKPSLKLTGGITSTINKFPVEMKMDPKQPVGISKTGDAPVYLTTYQKYWNKTPKASKGDFEITSRFNNDSNSFLNAGQETTLIVDVLVKKDAEYVMVNVPIPGGCSYADKKNDYRNESHREYFKNETAIFCENLSKGNYTFEIKLIPRYTGSYTLNPAKIELMYFPVFNANNEIKSIKIK